MKQRTHFNTITHLRVKMNQFGILSLKFIFRNNYIDRRTEVGRVLTSSNINHTNCCDYILDEVKKVR